MIIFSITITQRLKYISNFIGREITGVPIVLTDNTEEFTGYAGIRINYSDSRITARELWLSPHSLLFEKGIRPVPVVCFDNNDKRAFFKTSGDFPFDLFAASFYLLSRYEEYLPHQLDMYGRYAHQNSLAFKEGFLNIPLINEWVLQFKDRLVAIFPGFMFQTPSFRFLPTYDIDEAYSYRYKSWWRKAGGMMKDILHANGKKINERRKVLAGKWKDPFDAYEWMEELNSKYHLDPCYFFLVADDTGRYDRHILPLENALQQLIRQHGDRYKIGVHPSWQSGDQPALITNEINTIENIAGKKITASRQHFIRFALPLTYRHLIDAGIREDFSMGYGSINGFRASTASAFYWYDLEKEVVTELLLYPFCYMEANSFFEQRLSSSQALDEMRHYYNATKKVNGNLVTIWHNTFLGTGPLFAGWREVYEQFISEVAAQNEPIP